MNGNKPILPGVLDQLSDISFAMRRAHRAVAVAAFYFMGQGFDRTEMAIGYYDRQIFEGGTFADMAARQGPEIQINATDLGIGQRFAFNTTRFRLLCSELADFSVARAVAASSAVPVAFTPIVLENFDTCEVEQPAWMAQTRQQADTEEDEEPMPVAQTEEETLPERHRDAEDRARRAR